MRTAAAETIGTNNKAMTTTMTTTAPATINQQLQQQMLKTAPATINDVDKNQSMIEPVTINNCNSKNAHNNQHCSHHSHGNIHNN